MKRRWGNFRQAVRSWRVRIFGADNVWRAVVMGLLLIAATAVVAIWQWDWLRAGGASIEFNSATPISEPNVTTLHREPNSTTLRNVGLGIAGIIALIFAFWRSRIADRQADIANQQADTAQRGLLNERYQKGAEMLGSRVLSVRLGGIYALQSLALEQPKQYYLQIMRLLCAFVRYPTLDSTIEIGQAEGDETPSRRYRIREDTQAAMDAIIACRRENIALEEGHGDKPNLGRANLRGARLIDANLSGARLDRANLSGARSSRANLSGARLSRANLSGTMLEYAKLSGARLVRANLSGANLAHANLSGARLDRANLSGTRLSHAKLSGTRLSRANLSGTGLVDANLSSAWLDRVNLSAANLAHVNLSGARLDRADFSSTNLAHANLSGARLSRHNGLDPATYLTQAQLDRACADPDNPPKLDGVLDADTGKQLVWRGKPCPPQ